MDRIYDEGRNQGDYGHLDREALERRLRLAENACVMFGWIAAADDSPRDKAAHQVWSLWAWHVNRFGRYADPAAHPEHGPQRVVAGEVPGSAAVGWAVAGDQLRALAEAGYAVVSVLEPNDQHKPGRVPPSGLDWAACVGD